MNTKSLRIATLVVLLINLILVGLVELFTFEMEPGKGITGNGNPAVVLWFIELPAYLLLLTGIALIVHKERYLLQYNRIWVSFILLILLAVSILLQVDKAQRIHDQIEGRIEEYGWLNPYTNTIYINFYSFLSGILLMLLIQSVITLIRIRIKGNRT
ncbi:hypothetical protein SAMN05216378_3974 [Paenibacillus catalpae]|uniref:Uncharacterized protein n=1 Tax=Paenibacillus catalpae TaxID=1045775 RepID=A0A1I2D5Y1_9BACL|nr:hypothetical protein [Paenibacillus catalpae]SFE75936.1 hypothetical protein SAMN05216378_3974 [Paenibacillus catalpae]